jgi:hypothetical protein
VLRGIRIMKVFSAVEVQMGPFSFGMLGKLL